MSREPFTIDGHQLLREFARRTDEALTGKERAISRGDVESADRHEFARQIYLGLFEWVRVQMPSEETGT